MDTSSVPPSPRAVFDRLRRCALAYDADGFAELFAPDGVVDYPFGLPGLPPRLEGREQIRTHLTTAMGGARRAGRRLLAYDPLVVHDTLDPEVIVVEFDLHGEVRATGQTYQLPYIQVLCIRDGAIQWMRDYLATQRLGGVLELQAPAAPA